MNVLELSEQEIIRRGSLDRLREMHIDPYPAAEYPVDGYADEIKTHSRTTPSRAPSLLPAAS